MRKTPYLQWENILLDTSIIFSYLHATRNNDSPECNFVKRVIDDLNKNKSQDKKPRNFYVSAITIAEMYDKSTDRKKTETTVEKMNIKTMTYVSFDTDIAEHMTKTYHSVLGTKKQNGLARKLGFPEHDMTMVREWITKDLMIIATADYLKCDVAMTIDAKTFLPLCNEVEFPCCCCEIDRFNVNDTYIFEYNG